MHDLIQSLRELQPKLERFRGRPLKEMPTRAIFIDPILEALGWDVRDPDTVELEYATVDRKFVDYALKLNRKPVLLVEAKSLGDPLTDAKAVMQVVGYAANAGVVWCILTNGARWQVYRSDEEGKLPDKPLLEVSVDPRDTGGAALLRIAEQMWRFSREEFAKGALDAICEQTSLDERIRRGLDHLMIRPPRKLVNLVRDSIGERKLKLQQISSSLRRVWSDRESDGPSEPRTAVRPTAARRPCLRSHTRLGHRVYDEDYHVSGTRGGVLDLYRAIDRMCLDTTPGLTAKRCTKHFIAYTYRGHDFCWVQIGPSAISVALLLRSPGLRQRQSFARQPNRSDVWKDVVVLSIGKPGQFVVVAPLVKRACRCISNV